MKDGKAVVNVSSAKSKEYKRVLEAIAKTEKCPFCKENFRYHRKLILKEEKNWFITESSWPYKNTKHHFLIISKKHKEKFGQLNSRDFKDISYLANWAIKKYKIKGAGFILRFGLPLYTGSTVFHLHFHLISPKINKKTQKAKTIYFPIG